MIGAIIGGGIQAGLGIYGAIKGNQQKNEAKRAMKNLQRPDYIIPQELKDSLSDAEKMTVEGLPAEQKQEYVKSLEKTQQNYMKNAEDRKAGLMGLQETTNQANNQYTNLVSMDAQEKAKNKRIKQSALNQARTAMAGAKNRQFGINMDNYNSELTALQGDMQAGGQNEWAGIQQVGTAATNLAGTIDSGGGKGGGSFNNSDAIAGMNKS